MQETNSIIVPEGWKLVPIEPTAEMLEKGCDAFCNESLRNDPQGVKDQTYVPVYAAMLSAAPPVTGGDRKYECPICREQFSEQAEYAGHCYDQHNGVANGK